MNFSSLLVQIDGPSSSICISGVGAFVSQVYFAKASQVWFSNSGLVAFRFLFLISACLRTSSATIYDDVLSGVASKVTPLFVA